MAKFKKGPNPKKAVRRETASEYIERVNEDVKPPDLVNHPPHYTFGRIEVIDAIEDWGLDFHKANAVKYIARSAHKGNELQDLQKAVWYLQRKIDILSGKPNITNF